MSQVVRAGHDRWLAATAAVLFTLCLVALSPHLVHHLHHDADTSQPCAFLALAQHTPCFTAIAVDMPEPQDLGWLEPPARPTATRAEPLTVAPARAPPRVSLAA